ncbi:hypothetical protein [Halobacillus sp. K22]|uniref:hypothetical protein n=1 Tax=Halobacillus sp. K22 TaxID=3457431 RepID=UPI003FCEA5CF
MNKLNELTQTHVYHVLLSVYNRSHESKELDVVDIIHEMKKKLSSNIQSVHKRS